MNYAEYLNILRDVALDFVCLYFYAYWILYKKYNYKELFVACSLFNVFMLLVVITIVRTDFNIAIGFGLFALLSMVRLRSATFTKTEMAYFFGGVGLAVINGCGIADIYFLVACNVIVLLSAWMIGAWMTEHSGNIIGGDDVKNMIVVLDHIEPDAINNRSLMTEKLGRLFNLEVVSFNITKVDYVRDTIDLELFYSVAGKPRAKREPMVTRERAGELTVAGQPSRSV